MKKQRTLIWMALVLLLTSLSAGQISARPSQPSPPAAGAVTTGILQDELVTLVEHGVTKYDLAAPKLFWYDQPPVCPPPEGASPNQEYYDEISRIATYGSLTRTLYYEEVGCSPGVRSDLVADDEYVYWVGAGVMRLSTEANPGDPPDLLSSAVSGYTYLAQDTDYLFVLQMTSGGSLYRIDKATGSSTTLVSDAGTSPWNLQADGKYVYWLTAGTLKRIPVNGGLILNLASNVSGYHPEGHVLSHCTIDPPQCYYTEYVYVGQADEVSRYDNLTGNWYGPIYTSSDSTARVYSLDTKPGYLGQGNLFFFESREVYCDPNPPYFCSYQDVLMRTGRSGGTAEAIYVGGIGLPTVTWIAEHLETDGTHLFWQEQGKLQRLPNDADALPVENITARGMEVTQGIQDTLNSVFLIEDRRTFVRVRADSHDTTVAGVSAYLYRTDAGGQILEGPLVPVNPVGKQITVQTLSNRMNINESFLFELPWSWTHGTLYLKALVNPYKYPLEPDYNDNEVSEGPLTFQASPRLEVQFVSFGYEWDGTVYYPHLIKDVLQTYSWIRRAYPLASTPGSFADPTPGLRPNLWLIYDENLGAKVFIDPSCTKEMFKDPATYPHCSNLRASAYTNALMAAMRAESGIPVSTFMYGFIDDGLNFPRGQASGSANVSSGPAGTSCCGCTAWDHDGSCTDWYAGHEIGHTLGRAHPVPGSELCGHSADDPNYPYNNAQISNGWAYGFDGGDPGLNPLLQMAVYPGFLWYDVMSYCDSLWISDYTYEAMYDYMMAHNRETTGLQKARLQGDFLSVFGDIVPDSDTATFYHLRRLSDVAEIPALVPGDYSIRLLDAGQAILADHAFTPEPVENVDHTVLSFGQVVSFTAGTAHVQIVRLADSQVLVSETLSANPPAVSDVALQGAPDPVTGTVTLAWSASDPDGDPLSFDVLYSVDGGSNFQPLQLNVGASPAQIDTRPLGGSSSAVLRVVASDGVQSAHADSAPFTMEDKPPQPQILLPTDGTQIHYGQLLNFIGEALDAQDGSVSGANLVWSNQAGQLGTGALLSIDDLPVGTNTITLEATNSKGLSASTQITVVVDDDLDWPGPTLDVGPGQVSWHVLSGTTALQTAQVRISNAGGGSLDWFTSENAPWLSVDVLSGTAPFSLTLTADPAGMHDGMVLSATLVITAPASGRQTIQKVSIPVGIYMGDVYRANPTIPSHWIYLPLVLNLFTP